MNIWEIEPKFKKEMFPNWGEHSFRQFDLNDLTQYLVEDGFRGSEKAANQLYFVLNYVSGRMKDRSWWHVSLNPCAGEYIERYIVPSPTGAAIIEEYSADRYELFVYFTQLLSEDPRVILEQFLQCFHDKDGEDLEYAITPWVSVEWRDTVEEYYTLQEFAEGSALVLSQHQQGTLQMKVNPDPGS